MQLFLCLTFFVRLIASALHCGDACLMLNITPPTRCSEYRGRFAPSPSGNLHFGSLVTALASYVIARQAQGKWLLRIDDIDTPRIKAGASDAILNTLEAHGLFWDESVLYQSQRTQSYQSHLESFQQQEKCYYCDCTRQAIKLRSAQYYGFCRDRNLSATNCAIRLKNPGKSLILKDVLLGEVDVAEAIVNEDFVLRRRDGIWGYHLAAVLDDLEQGITQVVRGADLLLPSACQLVLYDLLGEACPSFLHIPVAVSAPGQKLSKQNHSPELDNKSSSDNLRQAIEYLGLSVPAELDKAPCSELLHWAIEHWNIRDLAATPEKKVAEQWC